MAIFCMVVGTLLSPTWSFSDTQAPILSSALLAWSARYNQASPDQQPGLLEEGREAAQRRQARLLELIRDHPEEALRQALPPATLAALPDEIRAYCERHIDGLADSTMFSSRRPPTPNSRDILIHGALHRAHVYGNLAKITTLRETPVRGIALGSEIALEDSAPIAQATGSARRDPGGTCTQTLSFSATDLRITRAGGFDYIELSGCDLPEDEPGSPALPVFSGQLLLPSGAEATALRVTASERAVAGPILPAPLQPPAPRSENRPDVAPPLAGIYQGSHPYPPDRGVIEPVSHLRGFSLLPVRLHPLRYSPASGELLLAESMTMEIDYLLPAFPPVDSPKPSPLFAAMALDEALVSETEPTTTAPSMQETPADNPVCDYLIITKSTLTNAFQALAQHRASHNGFSTEILSVEWIDATYDGTRPDGGSDIQTKVRNCIRDYVQTRATEYVVLGGDNTIITDRDCYVTCGTYTSSNMPTDLYFAGLDGNWDDVDADGIYGEANADGINDEGDLSADVLLGRIPIRTAQQATNYINKVIAFETNPPYELTRSFIMGGALLWDSYTNTQRPTDAMNDGHWAFTDAAHPQVSDAEMWARRTFRDCAQTYGWQPTRIGCAFDTLTSWDTAIGGDYPIAPTNLKTRFNEGWNILIFDTHGGSTTWSAESGSFSASQAQALTGLCVVVYTMACNTGGFDAADPSLSEGFLRAVGGGSLVYFGCSRYGWGSSDAPPASSYSTGGTSPAFMRKFLQLIFQNDYLQAGDVFYRHKAAYVSSSGVNGSYRWIQFGLNFQGDPAICFVINTPTLQVETPTPALLESSAAPAVIRLTRDNAVGTLTMRYAFNGSADLETDFESAPLVLSNPGFITMTSGVSEVLIELAPLDDDLPENTEDVVFQLIAGDSYTSSVDTVSVTLEEDDTDTDGMPDDWEKFYALDPATPDTGHNSDDDEYSDLEEYIAGTDPTDTGSRFASGPCLPLEAGPALRLPTQVGRYYTVDFKDRLDPDIPWQMLVENLPGTGSDVDIPLDHPDERRFYRLRVEMTP